MFVYIVKRLLLMVVTLFGITIITFVVTRLTPGEPSVVAQSASSEASGGYEAALEQNRRNLGLDKPLILNLNFEDRDYAAREAVKDFLRPARFWRQDARRRLTLSSTIALRPALDMIERLQETGGSVDHELQPTNDPLRRIDIDESINRLVELLPLLALDKPDAVAELESRPAKIEFWRSWVEAHQGRWQEEQVRTAVESYLNGQSDLNNVRIRGGYAVPYLMDAIDSGDEELALRANAALTGLTGFDYLGSSENWLERRGEVITRWKSFHSREKIRYSDYGAVGHTINIFANTQFGVWFRQTVTLDFGDSYKHRRPVMTLIKERLPVTFILAALSIFFSYLISIPLGVFSAVKRYTPGDQVATVILFVLYSLPVFWVGQMLLMSLTGGPSPWPGVEWPDLFPARGLNSEGYNWREGGFRDILDLLWHLVLPTICLTYGSLAFLSRQMRSAMLEVLNEDFVRTARAKGLSGFAVIFKHALRNSLIPILTLSAGLLPELIAGSIIIESIFTIPGMGLLSFEAILNRDYPVINAILFFSAVLTLIGILLADLSYALADPRITYD